MLLTGATALAPGIPKGHEETPGCVSLPDPKAGSAGDPKLRHRGQWEPQARNKREPGRNPTVPA